MLARPNGLRVKPAMTGLGCQAPRVSRDIALVTRRGRSLSPAAQSFIEVMRAELGKGKDLVAAR
jgi:DNA-binding transcriptional LysR family regulator